MLYLIDNPVVREAFFPSGTQPLAVEPARADDAAAVSAIARKHEGPEAAALLERWWDGGAGDLLGRPRPRRHRGRLLLALRGPQLMRRSIVAGDPVLEAWARDLRDQPAAEGPGRARAPPLARRRARRAARARPRPPAGST